MKYARIMACLLLPLALAACGEVRHVFPPAVSVDQLSAPPDGPWSVRLRLHNQSYDANVRFERVHLELSLGGVAAGTLNKTLQLEVAERDSDVTEVRFTPTTAARKQLAEMADQSLQYALRGHATISDAGENPEQYDIDHKAWLSPVPGIPHRYR